MSFRKCLNALPVALLLIAFALPLPAAAASDPVLAASLQAAMQQHIERNRVDGQFLWVDLKTGKLRKLAPGAAHPLIFAMGDGYVLCADMRDETGKDLNVDFFVAPRGKGFVVFQSEVDNRDAFRALVKQGLAKPMK